MYYSPDLKIKITSDNHLRKLFPNVSFPKVITEEILRSFNIHKLILVDPPEETFYTTVQELRPVFDGVNFIQVWETVEIPRTQEEIDAYNTEIKEKTLNKYKNAIQSTLDAFAKTRGYDNIFTLCTYATSTNTKFAAEGQRGVDLRDQCWDIGYQILAEVEAGTRPIPTIDQILAELPELTWNN